MLSLKVSVYVYDNYTCTDCSIEKIVHSDIEESEGEEKEIEQHQDIVSPFNKARISSALAFLPSYQSLLEQYNSRHLEFTTPPKKKTRLIASDKYKLLIQELKYLT